MKKLIESDDTFLYGTEKGVYKLQIINDNCCESPRLWDNIGTIIAFGGAKRISDKNQNLWDDAKEFLGCHPKKDWIILPLYMYQHSGVAYQTTPFQCSWDSGQIGFIYCSKEVAINEFGKKICTTKVREKAIDYMKGEIETFSNWANGQCYGYILELVDWNCVFDTTEEVPNFETCLEMIKHWQLTDEWEDVEFQDVHSCWGFIESGFGEEMYCYQEAVSMIV